MKNLLILKEDIKKYEGSASFIFLKAHWRLTEELKRKDLQEEEKKIIEADARRVLSIAKQMQDLEILEINTTIS